MAAQDPTQMKLTKRRGAADRGDHREAARFFAKRLDKQAQC
jgi:hypothetical protein